ncbi:MAG: YbjQ family protein [Bacillota bacterium]
MLLATSDLRTDYEVLGLVRGSCMQATHLGRDILASLRKLIGGEVTEYAELLKRARDRAIEDMVAQAEDMGANGIIGMRFSTASITSGAAEVIVYGTAVRI